MNTYKTLHPRERPYICQAKKEEDDSPALRIVLMYHDKDGRNTLKRTKKTNYNSP